MRAFRRSRIYKVQRSRRMAKASRLSTGCLHSPVRKIPQPFEKQPLGDDRNLLDRFLPSSGKSHRHDPAILRGPNPCHQSAPFEYPCATWTIRRKLSKVQAMVSFRPAFICPPIFRNPFCCTRNPICMIVPIVGITIILESGGMINHQAAERRQGRTMLETDA